MPRRSKSTNVSKTAGIKKKSRALKQRNADAKSTKRLTPKPSWKPLSRETKNYVLNIFDLGIRLLMHKVPESLSTEVYNALGDARNQVGVSLETLRVPPSKSIENYNNLSSVMPKLKESKKQLEHKLTNITKILEAQEKELQQLENEKACLEDFGKLPEKHHPLLTEPLENELHLHYNTVK